jgi:esterase/lipase superfamily enzyme
MLLLLQFDTIEVPPVPQTKAIMYGCSYSGALAAWAREVYPDLFFSAIAGSAPIQAQTNFHQYYDPMIHYGAKPCITAL